MITKAYEKFRLLNPFVLSGSFWAVFKVFFVVVSNKSIVFLLLANVKSL